MSERFHYILVTPFVFFTYTLIAAISVSDALVIGTCSGNAIITRSEGGGTSSKDSGTISLKIINIDNKGNIKTEVELSNGIFKKATLWGRIDKDGNVEIKGTRNHLVPGPSTAWSDITIKAVTKVKGGLKGAFETAEYFSVVTSLDIKTGAPPLVRRSSMKAGEFTAECEGKAPDR
jgi:hypothetical protein